jgi:2-phospho-L-lactate/phosphoenolpyruvate guanylyltransferase
VTVELLAAVPVKDLCSVKQRLMEILTSEERSALVLAMLEDVLFALGQSPVDALCLVTRDPAVIQAGRRHGARILTEEANCGHTRAVARAQAVAVAEGARRFLTIPGDVPCMTAAEVKALARALGTPPGAVFVPSLSGLGTNAALLAPADAMPLRFGEPSFDDHLEEARVRGLTPLALHLSGLALDIDSPEDLALLLDWGPDTRSAALLRERGVPARLATARARTDR